MLVREIKEGYEEVLKNRNHKKYIAIVDNKGGMSSCFEDNNSQDTKEMKNATLYNTKERDKFYEKFRKIKNLVDEQISKNIEYLFIIFIEE